LLNVLKINKQDMQNNICGIGVEIVFLSHKFRCRDICINCVIDDALLETMPDIDQLLLQFINSINLLDLARPAAAFLAYFCSQSGSVTMLSSAAVQSR